MSETTTQFMRKEKGRGLKMVQVAIGIIAGAAGIAGAFKAWAVLPYRIERLEDDQRSIKQEYRDVSAEQRAQREILIRIEERIKRTDRLANGHGSDN